MPSPACRSRMLLIFSVSFPETMTNGMIMSDGSDVSICKSSSLASGNVSVSWPRIGETASPGKAFRAEMDQMPISVIRGMLPCPVLILMSLSVQLVEDVHPDS